MAEDKGPPVDQSTGEAGDAELARLGRDSADPDVLLTLTAGGNDFLSILHEPDPPRTLVATMTERLYEILGEIKRRREYALILVLIAIVVIGILTLLGQKVSKVFSGINSGLKV